MDHFALLDLPRSPRLDPETVEQQFFRKSRETHPDLATDDAASESAVLLQAELNEAFRVLSKPWTRYAYLAELLQPGVMTNTKKLPPTFLMQAMELSEAAAEVRGDDARATLRQRLTAEREELRQAAEEALVAGDATTAAGACHRARYYDRALETLARVDHSASTNTVDPNQT